MGYFDVPPAVRAFYQWGTVAVPILEARAGGVAPRTLDISFRHRGRCVHETDGFSKRLEELQTTTRVIASGGYAFEIAEVNRASSSTATLQVSTYRSSITGNPGNAAELAYEDQGRRLVYVSSLGQGRTSPLTNSEKRRFARTGSLLCDERGRADPLPVCHALQSALEREGVEVVALRSDSSGRLLTSALGWCLPPSSLISILHNATPNVGSLTRLRLTARLLAEDYAWARGMAKRSPDCDRIDSLLRRDIADALPSLYGRHRGKRHGGNVKMAEANLRGLARPSRHMQTGAAVSDLALVHEKHPHAVCALVFGSLDPLFAGVSRGELLLSLAELSRAGDGAVRCAVVAGARHNAHTAYPHFYRELEDALTTTRDA